MNHTGSFSFFVLVHCSRLLDVLVMTAVDGSGPIPRNNAAHRESNRHSVSCTSSASHQDGAWIKTGGGL